MGDDLFYEAAPPFYFCFTSSYTAFNFYIKYCRSSFGVILLIYLPDGACLKASIWTLDRAETDPVPPV